MPHRKHRRAAQAVNRLDALNHEQTRAVFRRFLCSALQEQPGRL